LKNSLYPILRPNTGLKAGPVSNQDSVVLAKEKVHKSMKQNHWRRNIPTQIYATIFTKIISWRKDSFVNKWYWNNWISI
jgi:hypothetical protein